MTLTENEFKQKCSEILRDNITFAGQIETYIIHGAIEKIWELHLEQIKSSSRDQLLAFCQDLFKDWFDSPDGTNYVGLLRELAIKHGLFEAYKPTEPCCENCECAIWYNLGLQQETILSLDKEDCAQFIGELIACYKGRMA